MSEIHYRSAGELIDELKTGRLSSVALTQALIDRIKTLNPHINAVVTLAENEALKQAAEADARRDRGETLGPLHGLPMTLKDTWEVAGLHCVAGAPAMKDYIPQRHADMVERLVNAGAIVLGKTNTPLYAMDIQSFNRVFGTTSNPYNRDHTPGGSSGGAAAALAAGLTPLEVGSDLAGSIRTPAHFCGIFGHKPTRDLVSMRGHIPGPPGTESQPDLVEGGPMARTAGDLERLLKVIAGPRPIEARNWALNLEAPRIESLEQARIGLWLEDTLCPVDNTLTTAYRHLAQALENEGALVAQPEHKLLDLKQILPAYYNLMGTLVSASLRPPQRRQLAWVSRLEPVLRRFTPMTACIGEYSRGVNQPAHRLAIWRETREKMRVQIDALFQEYDVLLTPITPTTAIQHDHEGQAFSRRITVNGQQRPYLDQFCWIALATLLGLPATSVPVGLTNDGLPFNIQVIGAPGADLTTIRFAELMEKAGLAGFRKPEGY
ncbi:amidase [Marinobacter nanhaiticus D15-8W]|uniref:Amidase n=1 Tax=Marinobacter nanhaiticus D15-8W TaxID=626887 RepID=N6X0N6_9GAMM|nr:amidase [Marinobacter nanhaiticus]ENO17002.1 amidase [Marinobacter nanhaiticus D15-8W]BES72002.1 amidase [Marinobacter nanhaiticus D15-8W]